MTVLTFALFLSFGAVAIKSALEKVRSLDADQLKGKVRSMISRQSSQAKDAPSETELTETARVEREPSAEARQNPMYRAGGGQVVEV